MENFGYVVATKILVEAEMPVLYAYRERPENDQDSGWRFFAGIETKEYVNDPENIAIYDVTTILSIDPSIRPLLDFPASCAFGRDDPDKGFQMWNASV